MIMAYSKQLFRTVLLILLSFLPLELCAQATIDELLDGYVSTSVSGESVTPYITKINQIYKNYRKDQQVSLRSKIYDRVVVDTIMEQNKLKGKFALIDLYAILADSNDSKLDDLYFKKGEICGLHTGDTIVLKECITSLKLSDNSKTPQVTKYISTLNDYLEEIRNYLPVSKRIDGVWVSDVINYDVGFGGVYSAPLFVLNIAEGKIKMENIGIAEFLAPSIRNDFNTNYIETYAQNIVDLRNEKIYAMWATERLKIPNQSIALSLGQKAGDIATEVTQGITRDIIGNIGGDILGGFTGNIISNAVMGMYAPSKKIFIVEMEIEYINYYELVASVQIQKITIDGRGNPVTQKDRYNVLFSKYNILSGVFYGCPGQHQHKYTPGYGGIKEGNAHGNFNMIKKYEEVFKHNGVKTTSKNFQRSFNKHQNKKLIYFNEQMMLSDGVQMSNSLSHLNTSSSYMGIESRQNTDANSVYVYDVHMDSPAYMFGLKKGDYILNIDGFEMKSYEQLANYIYYSHHPYDWITVHVKRGKKEMNITLELSY